MLFGINHWSLKVLGKLCTLNHLASVQQICSACHAQCTVPHQHSVQETGEAGGQQPERKLTRPPTAPVPPRPVTPRQLQTRQPHTLNHLSTKTARRGLKFSQATGQDACTDLMPACDHCFHNGGSPQHCVPASTLQWDSWRSQSAWG